MIRMGNIATLNISMIILAIARSSYLSTTITLLRGLDIPGFAMSFGSKLTVMVVIRCRR